MYRAEKKIIANNHIFKDVNFFVYTKLKIPPILLAFGVCAHHKLEFVVAVNSGRPRLVARGDFRGLHRRQQQHLSL